jgi:hypothetical protein
MIQLDDILEFLDSYNNSLTDEEINRQVASILLGKEITNIFNINERCDNTLDGMTYETKIIFLIAKILD